MGSTKKLVRNFVVFIALILLTLWVILKDQIITDILDVYKDVKMQYIFIGIICMAVFLILEGVNIKRTLKELGEKVNLKQCIKYSLIGFFFSSITPAASGGQPMQIYYMHKDKISVANSTLSLLINLTSMQITTISLAIFSLIVNYKFMNRVLIIFFCIGIFLNASALVILLISIISKRISKALIKFTVKILKFFKVKNLYAKKKKVLKELKLYQSSAKYVKSNKRLMIKIFITTIIQFTIYYSIAYWTYCALDRSGNNIFELTTMQSVLFATVSGIPSPGAVGVSEGAFIEIFRNVYPVHMIKSATLIHRGINFYLFVLISGIIVIVNDIKSRKIED